MVTIDKLEKTYGDFSLNISMEIPDGAIIGLVGKNGAGKSTTIKAILGLIQPDAGKVTVFGKDAGELGTKDKENIGVALAGAGFNSVLNIKDVAKIMKKMYHNFDTNQFMEDCKRFKLPADKQIKDFSTGMRARLRVLVALSHDADLLIMDEPTAGLDVEARNVILDMIREYVSRADNRSVILTSHISTDLEGLCDRIYLLHKGSVILEEDADVILDRYAILKVDEEQYGKLDKSYLLKTQKESYGYSCLTNEKRYYMENYPGIVVNNGNLDDLILMLTGDK